MPTWSPQQDAALLAVSTWLKDKNGPQVFRLFGWVGSYAPLIVPLFFGSAFNIFLLRQFMMTIPLDLTDAAHVDGAGDLVILWSIMVPLIRPAIGFVFVISIIGFIVSSALCGAAQNLDEIVLFRVMQGLFGGAMMPLAQSALIDLYPLEQRGTAWREALRGCGITTALPATSLAATCGSEPIDLAPPFGERHGTRLKISPADFATSLTLSIALPARPFCSDEFAGSTEATPVVAALALSEGAACAVSARAEVTGVSASAATDSATTKAIL